MNKKEINTKLKEAGYANIKLRSEDGADKTYKNWQGKMVKGICGGSIGPMTMTSAHRDHNRKAEQKLKDLFYENGTITPNENGVTIVVPTGIDKFRKMVFTWNLYPTYTRGMDLDPSYETYYLTGNFTDIKE